MTGYRWQRNLRAKLTEEQAKEIILGCTRREQDAEFAERFGIVVGQVSAIRRGRAWAGLRLRMVQSGELKQE